MIDYAILLMESDVNRVKHVNEQIKKHPYFRIISAADALNNWDEVERILLENEIRIAHAMKYDKIGKFGRWASFIRWLVWLRDEAPRNKIKYGVLIEDDVVLNPTFKIDLTKYIQYNPEKWYFRGGTYNSCIVVKQEKAGHILDLIRESKINMPDDWWSWKAVKILQAQIPLVKQLTSYKSNIASMPSFDKLNRPRNPLIWD